MSVQRGYFGNQRVVVDGSGRVYRDPKEGWIYADGVQRIGQPYDRWVDAPAVWLGHLPWWK